MIVQCGKCLVYYDDEFRFTFCPHDTFAANDGHNNFEYHNDAYRSLGKPKVDYPIYESPSVENVQ